MFICDIKVSISKVRLNAKSAQVTGLKITQIEWTSSQLAKDKGFSPYISKFNMKHSQQGKNEGKGRKRMPSLHNEIQTTERRSPS